MEQNRAQKIKMRARPRMSARAVRFFLQLSECQDMSPHMQAAICTDACSLTSHEIRRVLSVPGETREKSKNSDARSQRHASNVGKLNRRLLFFERHRLVAKDDDMAEPLLLGRDKTESDDTLTSPRESVKQARHRAHVEGHCTWYDSRGRESQVLSLDPCKAWPPSICCMHASFLHRNNFRLAVPICLIQLPSCRQ